MANNNDTRNLQNIQRIDRAGNNWTTKDQVGPLFVYKRLNYPRYAIMIANRQSLEDFVQPIEETSSLRYDPPYILIHRTDGSIGGIWIYGEDECKRIFASIQQLRDLVVEEDESFNSGVKESAKSPEKTIQNVKKPAEVAKADVKTPEKVAENANAKKPPEVKDDVKKTETSNKTSQSSSVGRYNFRPLKTLDASKMVKMNVRNKNVKPPVNVEPPKQQQVPSTPRILSRVHSINNFVKEAALPKTSDIAAAAASVLPEIIQENGHGGEVGILKTILLEFVKRIDTLEKRWKRTETEGPLVVFSRIDEPFYSLLVVDRKQRGKKDFLQPLVPGIKLTNKAPYIFISGREDMDGGAMLILVALALLIVWWLVALLWLADAACGDGMAWRRLWWPMLDQQRGCFKNRSALHGNEVLFMVVLDGPCGCFGGGVQVVHHGSKCEEATSAAAQHGMRMQYSKVFSVLTKQKSLVG
uniref:Uncharacterized protein n=1 Tax=Meloidogyne hapla TaxID=6305 RepID=A0A1I8BHJ5_MELHA